MLTNEQKAILRNTEVDEATIDRLDQSKLLDGIDFWQILPMIRPKTDLKTLADELNKTRLATPYKNSKENAVV